MIRRLFNRRIREYGSLFNGHFIEVKALYALEFDAVCCISFIGEIDGGKAFAFIRESMGLEVVKSYQHAFFDHNDQGMLFNNTIFVLNNKRMIELGNNWCQVLHTPNQHGWANNLIRQLSQYRVVQDEPVIGFARQSAN